jgi:hypothetical protein
VIKGEKCREHGVYICTKSPCLVITDAARRFVDDLQAILCRTVPADVWTGWVAIRLFDGRIAPNVFPSKRIAADKQSDEKRFAYLALRTCPAGMPLKDAQCWLNLHRHMYDNSIGLIDPDAPGLIMPQAREDPITRPLDERPKHETLIGEYAEKLVRRRM